MNKLVTVLSFSSLVAALFLQNFCKKLDYYYIVFYQWPSREYSRSAA